MKRASKVLAILMAFALVMSFAAMSASAESQVTTTFNKYLVVDDTAQIPNMDFGFSINPGTAIAGTSTTLSIKAGVGTPTVEAAHFTSGMETRTGTPTNASESGKKYATDEVVIDFTNVDFTEPGIYRYVVTENQGTAPGVTYDNTPRYLDVFVEKVGENYEISGYAMRTTADTFDTTGDPMVGYSASENPDVKESSFTNSLQTVDLTFSKTITGNQADMTKRFEFTLDLSNVNPGTYTLSLTGDAAAIVGAENDTVGSDGTNYTISVDNDPTTDDTYTFYLTNGESVTVKDLNKGFTYEVSEKPQDYTPSVDGASTDTATGSNIQADTTNAFTNTSTGIIPTGVIITIAPFMIGLLLFGAVMMFMISRRRRAAY